jgi:hypothetical protein
MRANAISFQNAIPKIYETLPPPLEELDQVLACMFTGPCQPTKKDIERTPLLVRHNEVGKAMRWLKLNHADYQDIEISEANLEQYSLNGTPVVIDYQELLIIGSRLSIVTKRQQVYMIMRKKRVWKQVIAPLWFMV